MSKIYPYGGFWKRFAAFLIDAFIITIPLTVLYMVWMLRTMGPLMTQINASAAQAPTPDMIPGIMQLYGGMLAFQVISFLVFWLYYAFMESSSYQATLGKMALRLKVVNAKGKRITFWHATGRTLAKWISGITLYIGFLIAGANKHKQALHDIIASTYVVDKSYQPGDPLPEVKTHYVLLGLSIAGVLFVLIAPFVLVALLAMNEITHMPQVTTPSAASFSDAAWEEQVAPVMHKLQDLRALSKMPQLQQLPKEQQNPFAEEDYNFSFEDDGTVRAQRANNAAYAFIMRPDDNWPCCQPLVPEGCEDVSNVDVCQAK